MALSSIKDNNIESQFSHQIFLPQCHDEIWLMSNLERM